MKPLNRNRAFVALAIIVIPLLIIIGMGKMSVLTSILSMFTVLFLTIVAGVYILYRFPADGAKGTWVLTYTLSLWSALA